MVTKVSEALIDRVRATLLDGPPLTYFAVAKALGVSITAANAATRVLYERNQTFVKDFERCAKNGNMIPLYAVGNEPDAELPDGQAMRKNRHIARMRQRAWTKPFRNWFDVALFGDAPPVADPTKWHGRVYRQSMEVEELEEAA